jgi:hypothetical protein
MNDSTQVHQTLTPEEIIKRAAAVWRKAQVLYETPPRNGQPEARAMADAIAADHPECEQRLLGLLDDPSQLVVGYALLTLEMLGSPALRNLPSDLLARRSQITLQNGSVRTSMDLGGLARQIQKRERERAERPNPGVTENTEKTIVKTP